MESSDTIEDLQDRGYSFDLGLFLPAFMIIACLTFLCAILTMFATDSGEAVAAVVAGLLAIFLAIAAACRIAVYAIKQST